MKKILITTASIVSLLIFSTKVYAQEIVVEGNGQNSQNQVSVDVSNTTNVTQENNANVENNVDVAANTGGNQASGNTSDQTTITTGDIQASSTVENSVNTSVAEIDCCPQSQDFIIKGNGADSQNTIDVTVTSSTNINVTQNAYIQNNVHGTANTGENSANNNSGSVSITTGDIEASDVIKNTGINLSHIVGASAGGGDVRITISENGSDSVNLIKLALAAQTIVDTQYDAYIDNLSIWELNTGKNSANGNIGNVDISTGDIIFNSNIENGPINIGIVDLPCCPKGGLPPPPPPPSPPPPPPTPPEQPRPPDQPKPSDGGGDGGKGGDGEKAGEVLGAMLPITGSFWMLLMSLASVLMFLMGWYLRLRSGNAPPKAYAV